MDDETTTPPPDGREPAPVDQILTVRQGQSLSVLARENYGDWRLWPYLYDANRARIGAHPDLLKVGTTIRIPGRAPNADAAADLVARAEGHMKIWQDWKSRGRGGLPPLPPWILGDRTETTGAA